MNKADFVAKIAEKAGLTRKQADAAVAAFTQTVTEALKAGDPDYEALRVADTMPTQEEN